MKIPAKDIIYVSIQLLLFVAYLFSIKSLALTLPGLVRYAGMLVAIIGIVLVFSAFYYLNKNLTAFPSPKQSGTLVTTGIFKYIRHPIYSGILAFAVGYGLYSGNGLRLIVFAALAVLFVYKSRYEEQLLENKFSGYKNYREKTAALLPGVY